jgi:hypothetical protein
MNVLQARVQAVAVASFFPENTSTPDGFIAAVLAVAVTPHEQRRPDWDRSARVSAIVYAEWEVMARLLEAVREGNTAQADSYRAHFAAIKKKQVSQRWFED